MNPYVVAIDYTNYRGERAWRRVEPVRFYFGETEHHRGLQWLMEARDLEKRAERTFALKDIHAWNPAPEACPR